MNNSETIWAYQFNITLPEGMEIDKTYDPAEYNQDRYPNSEDRSHRITYKYNNATADKQADGSWIIIVSTDQYDERIMGNSGEILKVYYTTSASMAPGVYPIKIDRTVMTITGSSDIKPATSYSYVIIGDDNPLKTEAEIDLSSMRGYIPSFVVEAMNADLAENQELKSVNLSGATDMGAELNTNALVSTAGGNVSYEREYAASLWSTVCLPFALNESQVSAIKAGGCEIEKLSGYDDASKTVTFDAVSSMDANTPYLVKCTTAYKPFANLTGVTVPAGATAGSVTVGDMTMCGTYEKTILSSSSSTTYFGYQESDGELKRIGSNATVKPYRAYMALNGSSSAPGLAIKHSDGEVTYIHLTKADQPEGNVSLYDLSGKNVDSTQLKRGIYVKEGKKFVK